MTRTPNITHARMRAQNHIHWAQEHARMVTEALHQIDALLDVDGFRPSDAEDVIVECGLTVKAVEQAVIAAKWTALVDCDE